jgi:hypothetical protein
MAGNDDFLALYQELGLRADCSLEEFKLAHRKRVGALHPDRAGGGKAAIGELPRLNALYTRAMDFHRRHGRLPGAAQSAATATTGPRVPPRPVPPSMAAPDAAPAPRRRNRLPVLLVLVAALVAAWLWAHPVEFEPAPDGVPAARAARTSAAPARPATAQTFELGSPAKRVRALQGAPLGGWEQHWDYGPSWVEFRCGVVTGWYSSPLRPLKVASSGPPAASDFVPPRNCKE